MIKLTLTTDGQTLDLPPGFQLPVEIESNLFDLDAESRIYSFPFELPSTPQNKRALQFPNYVGSQNTSVFAAMLSIDSINLSGQFVLTKSTKTIFTGFFKSGIGLLKEYGNRFLGEFLDFTLGTAGMSTLTFYNTVITQYLSKKSPVCFPETLFPLNVAENGTFRANNYRADNGGVFLLVSDVADPLLLPCINIVYALEQFVLSIGYNFDKTALQSFWPEIEDVYFFNNIKPYKGRDTRIRTGPTQNILQYPMRLGDFVPEFLTIKEFFEGLKKTFGIWLFIDDNLKTVRAFFLKDLVKRSWQTDFTDKISPNFSKEETNTPPVFSFEFAQGISDANWVKVGVINQGDPIPDLLDNEIVFVEETNQWLKRADINPFFPSEKSYIPFSYGENNYTKSRETDLIKTPFSPARKVYALEIINAQCRVEKSGNKVVLVTNFISPISIGSVYVEDPQSAWGGAKSIITLFNNYITIDFNWNAAPFIEGDYITCRFVFPLTQYGNMLDYTQEGDNLICLYHGLQSRPPGGVAGLRTYASPDSYGVNNQALSPLWALRWDFEDGLVNLFWKEYEAYLSRASYESQAAFNQVDLNKAALAIFEKIKYQSDALLIEKISFTASNAGLQLSTIKLK